MSGTTTRIASAKRSDWNPNQEKEPQRVKESLSLLASLKNYTLLGAAATSLLSFVELVDLNFQLTPVFQSLSDRLAFTAYFSLNLLSGSLIGLAVGLFASCAGWLKSSAQRALVRSGKQRLWHNLMAGLAVSALAAALLYQQPHIFRYVLGLIREAEKIALANWLLRAERLFAYLAIMALVIGCWIIWSIARASRSFPALLRSAWLLCLIALIAAAYYVDSRIEVLQYEYSFHRSLFLLNQALAMALLASIYFSSARFRALIELQSRLKNSLMIAASLLLMLLLGFTFYHFDKDQNLKTQIFFRTTQAKQHFKLARWAIDLDRDGYSAILGGGDADDSRADINPGQIEIIGDGLDNNCIGGDLSQQDVDEWKLANSSMNAGGSSASARRMNIIYIFVDTVRADHLSLYGYERETSPNIDKLASRSSVFENAYTPSPSTYQAVPKFMQGSYWDAHLETWTEVLARNGYFTILFPGRRDKTLRRRMKDPHIVSAPRTSNLEETVDIAIDMLGKSPADRPFFAYLYSFEPHSPYKLRHDFFYGSSLTDLYDGEIAYSDFHYGRLFDWLEKSGRLNDTMIIIMSDHAESLGERGVYKHNAQLYDEQMHVPAIIYIPGLAPRRIADYVSTIDLGPTILNAVGLECPKQYAGVSLLPLMRGEPFTHPPVYGEHWQRNDSPFLGPEYTIDPEIRKYMVITQDGYKLIYNRDVYSFELFNLKEDPKEERNLYERMAEKAQEMKKLLGRFVDIVSVSRPWDADENRYFLTTNLDNEDQE